jgi:hypothetical protein
MYIPLTVKAWKGLPQNFATYMLWGLLDAIVAGSIILKHGNFMLPAAYVLCCVALLVAILRAGTFKWGRMEWIVSLLVVISAIVWMFVGDRAATVVSTTGVALASIPQLVDFWHKPRHAPIVEYIGFTVGNTLSIIAGKNWSVEERFYPTVCTALTLLFVLVAARKWLPSHRLNAA